MTTRTTPSTRRARLVAPALVLGAGVLCSAIVPFAVAQENPAAGASQEKKVDPKVNRVSPEWKIHDMDRPKPAVVDPGTFSTQDQPGKPPSDAVVLFDGKDLSQWKGEWKVENGYFEVAGKGGLETKDAFGDMQLHVEWSAPTEVKGSSQGRGNSGIYINGKYEIQVLDSFDNPTYADGQASSVYGQNPPLVNATRKPGEWNVYDIIWRGPRFDADGKLTRPATVTVLHNGVLTQDHYTLAGGSGHHTQPVYQKHPEKGPISLQNHSNPVRYRNIWVRPLPDLGPQNQKIDPKPDGAPAAAGGDAKPANAGK